MDQTERRKRLRASFRVEDYSLLRQTIEASDMGVKNLEGEIAYLEKKFTLVKQTLELELKGREKYVDELRRTCELIKMEGQVTISSKEDLESLKELFGKGYTGLVEVVPGDYETQIMAYLEEKGYPFDMLPSI